MKARIVLTSRYFDPAERIALLKSLGLHADDPAAPSTGMVLKEATKPPNAKVAAPGSRCVS